VPTQEEVRQNWIKWALEVLNERLEEYEELQDYYNGDHELAFSTDKWKSTFGSEFEEFSDNWCQIVIDSLVQRLEILGWESDNADNASRAEEVWDRINGTLEADDVHTQAAIKGDAFLMVWEDPDNPGEAQMFFNDATEMQVYYDPQNPHRIIRAAKTWKDLSSQIHLYIYFPDHTEKWFVPNNLTVDQAAAMQAGLLDEHDASVMGFYKEDEDVVNEFGLIPVFHFKNRGKGQPFGLSEISSVIPIQNAINKLWMDLIVGSEFGSFRQKVIASGAQPKDGWQTGGDRVWATSDVNAKWGEFGQIDLEPIFKAIEVAVAHVGKITQTPMHYLRTSGDMPSGEALKTAESGLVQKTEDRQKHWGSQWGAAMQLALRIEGVDEPERLEPKWKAAATRHELEQAQTAQLKSILGIPLEHLWSEHFGYTEDEIAEFKDVNKAVAATVLANVINQISQLPPGAEQVTQTPEQLVALLKNQDPTGNAGEGTGLDVSQILSMLPKAVTGQTTAGEATAKPQANTRPPASPTRRSSGFKD
jgi:hypothetical protein